MRVRVAPDEVGRATATLMAFGGSDGVTSAGAEPGWISVRTAPDRAGEVNRALAGAGIWATALESGNDLEMLFLELTGGEPVQNGEHTFFGMAGAGRNSGSTGTGSGA